MQLLIVEDNVSEAELTVQQLRADGIDCTWTRVATEDAFREALRSAPDLIISDCTLRASMASRHFRLRLPRPRKSRSSSSRERLATSGLARLSSPERPAMSQRAIVNTWDRPSEVRWKGHPHATAERSIDPRVPAMTRHGRGSAFDREA